jgi:hypothetical protein
MATRKAAAKTEENKSPEDFVEYGEGFADIELSRAMDLAGVKVSKLRMREPVVRDQVVYDKLKGSDLEKEITIFANLCEMDEKQIQSLTQRDYIRLSAAYAGFLV